MENIETNEPIVKAHNIDKDVDKIFDDLNKINPYGGYLEDCTLSNVDEYYDTGCYALNAIVSGSLFGGIPKGRLTGFTGDSGVGKSLIVNRILANAQGKGQYIAIFDSENAQDKKTALAIGLDPKRTRCYPVYTIPECNHQVNKLLDSIEQNPNLRGKFTLAIDSLGNLSSSKEVKDAAEGNSAADMGTRAKQLNGMLRILTGKAAKTGTTILFTNHTYDDPASMYPSAIKDQSGGKKTTYIASVLIQLSRTLQKIEDDDEAITEAKKYNGVTLKAFTTKNRFIPPFLEVLIYNTFMNGLDRYSGIVDLAVNHKVLEGEKTFTLNGEKVGYRKQIEKNPELVKKLLNLLEEKIKLTYKYNKPTEND